MKSNLTVEQFRNREQWLNAAAVELSTLIAAAGYKPTDPYLSVGIPSGSRKAIGQAWTAARSADGKGHIFICPSISDATTVLATLLHELGHDTVGVEHGHRAPFSQFCQAVGLVKPWTATTPNAELRATLATIAQRLGPYPHAELDKSAVARKPQPSRMRLYQCPGCEQKVRAATDTLAAVCTDCDMPFQLQSAPVK